MKYASRSRGIRFLALMAMLVVCANADARDLQGSKAIQKGLEQRLAALEEPQLGPSRCAEGVTLLGISSATPGTALGKLREDDALNQGMTQLRTEFGDQISQERQLRDEQQRLDQKLEDLAQKIEREQATLRSLAGSSNRPAYAASLAVLKDLVARRNENLKTREDVAWKLELVESGLTNYYERESNYQQQAREVAERYGCT